MPVDDSQLQPEADERSPAERLDSWKEIAEYLGREPRTVQRWEKKKGLPVRRLVPDSAEEQPRVFAYKSEIDAWWKERQTKIVNPQDDDDDDPRKRIFRFTTLAVALILSVLAVSTYVVRRTMLLPPKVLAVMPFQYSSGDPAVRDIARALTDEMISRLGGLHPELSVIELTPSDLDLQTDVIGRRFNAAYILKGSVRLADQQVGITAQLLSVKPQQVLWGFSDKSEMKQLIDFEIKIANTIANEVLKVLPHSSSPVAHQASHEAYEDYLTGRALWNRRTADSLKSAIGYFQRAIESDPRYAPAYAGMADCYSLLGSAPYTDLPPKLAFPQAKDAAQQALKLDGTLSEAHLSLGYAELVYDWNFDEAKKEFERALELRPSSATAHQYYAYYLTAIGESQRAIEERKIAQQLQPDSPLFNTALGEAYYQARDFDQSISQNQKSLVLDPSYAIALINIGRAYEQKKMYTEALKAFRRIQAAVPEDPVLISLIGHTEAVSGNQVAARAAIAQLQRIAKLRYVPSLYIALVYTGLNEKDEAFHWLDKAYEERCEYLVYLTDEPLADPLRSDPRFSKLIQRIRWAGQSAQTGAGGASLEKK